MITWHMKSLENEVNAFWLVYPNNVLAPWLLNPEWNWMLIGCALEEGRQAGVTQII